MTWEKTNLGKCITTKKGFAFKSSKYVKFGVPIIRVSNFTTDSISNDDLKYYPLEEKINFLEFELHEKDVIIQTVGSWQNNPASVVGKVVRVPYYLEGALLNQNAVKLIPKHSIDNNYLFYRLKTDEFKGYILGEARGAANQASITLDTIKSFEFMIPDKEKQIKIGNILSAYDELIENNQKQIKLLEEAAQRLYKEWFVDLRFPGYETTQIIDGVPEGWSKKSVDNSLEMYIGGGWGKEVPTGNNVIAGKVIRGTDINDIKAGNFKDVPLRYHTKNDISKRNLQKYDIVFELSNGNINNIGRNILIDDFILEKCGKNTICASFCKLFRPLDKVHSLILYCEIQYMQNSGRMLPFKKQGSNGINNFAFEEFLNHEFLVPNDEKYITPIDNVSNLISVLQNQVSELIEARERLLPKLMSGELEV